MLAVAHRFWSGTGRGNWFCFMRRVHHHLWCLMRIRVDIIDDEKKEANLAKLLYDAPIRSENVVRIGPVFANFNCLRELPAYFYFHPGRCSFFLRSFPSFVFAPLCSNCSEVAQVGGRWRGRKCEHTPPPHVWFVHLALDLSPLAHHFASLTFRQRSHKRNQQHVSLSRDAAFWSLYIFLRLQIISCGETNRRQLRESTKLAKMPMQPRMLCDGMKDTEKCGLK